jgi:hypothetical protein
LAYFLGLDEIGSCIECQDENVSISKKAEERRWEKNSSLLFTFGKIVCVFQELLEKLLIGRVSD